MPACPHCSASGLTRDGYDQRGRAIYAGRACGRHATTGSASLTSGHRFPRDIILLAVRYYLQLGAAAERIAASWPTAVSTSVDGPFSGGSRSSGRRCPGRSVGTESR